MYGDLSAVTLEGGESVNGIKVSIPNPPKSAIVRLPSSKEVTTYLNRYLDNQRKKGTAAADRTPDLELFNQIRLDRGEEFDEFEAEFIISRLTGCRVQECEKGTTEYSVRLKTPFGETVHVLRAPTFKEMAQYRRACTQGKLSITPTLSFYDSLAVSNDGYAASYTVADIPPNHKTLVIGEVALAHDEIDPLQLDPNV